MSYRVTFDDGVARDLENLPAKFQARVFTRAEVLTDNPKPGGSRGLTGRLLGYRRLRVGDYRVIYSVDEATKEVTIWAVGPRRNVYDDFARRGH